MRRAIWWASLGLRLLVVGIVVLVAVFDWHWFSGYVVRKASEALGRTAVIEGNLNTDFTEPPLIRAEQVKVAVFKWLRDLIGFDHD